VAGLVKYNFGVVNLANNHALDQGLDGIKTTRKVLTENKIKNMGVGENLSDAWQPAVIEKNGIKVGFVGASYASVNDGGKTSNSYVARIEDSARLQSTVKNLKQNVDFVVVTMHAGTEYTTKPNQDQINFAHLAIDSGADLVIGAHPHWIQEKEYYCPDAKSSKFSMPLEKPTDYQLTVNSDTQSLTDQNNCRWIYYSLGNFIFDQSWSEQTKKGLALKITLTKPFPSPFNREEAPAKDPNAAMLSDLQPTNSPATTSPIQIQEIPILIEDNCCPVVENK
jgi:poly-gamma-glutamate synthesis protein (capsule biosynthesis protein)